LLRGLESSIFPVRRAFFAGLVVLVVPVSPCRVPEDACSPMLVRAAARDRSLGYSGFSGLWAALMRWGQVGCGGLARGPESPYYCMSSIIIIVRGPGEGGHSCEALMMLLRKRRFAPIALMAHAGMG
jgi:hypothetical protein